METDRSGNDKVKCAVMDTNVLMYVYLNKVDVISQLRDLGYKRFIVPKVVKEELEKLEKNLNGRERLAAKFALSLIEKFEIVETEGKGDEALIEAAKNYGCVLITNDKNLKRRAKKLGLTLGYLKENRRVFVESEL